MPSFCGVHSPRGFVLWVAASLVPWLTACGPTSRVEGSLAEPYQPAATDGDRSGGDGATAGDPGAGDTTASPGDAPTTGGDSAGPPGDDDAPATPVLDFGYYRVDTTPTNGQNGGDIVNGWTNLAYVDWHADARAFDFDPGADMTTVKANMAGIMQRMTGAGLNLMMDLAHGDAWGPRLTKQAILTTAQPYWDQVRYIMLGDELTMSKAEANAAIAEFRSAMNNLGLASRPIGVTLTPDYVLGNPAMLSADWDYIAIEAYTPVCSCAGCGTGNAAADIAAISAHIAEQEALIPADKDLVMIMQAYDRNGGFTDIEDLAAVNRATYFDMVKGNPRYKALIMFNWHREGSQCAGNPYPGGGHGTSGLPELQAVHQEIWADLSGL